VKKILGYLSEVKLELTKVTWPKRDEIVRLTLIVLAISAIVGLFSGGLDYIFTKLLSVFVVK
jgi:preprotein translocase subunit SecE